jgi:hypothetical protein
MTCSTRPGRQRRYGRSARGEGGADVQSAIDQVPINADWPSRPNVVGAIATKRSKVADAPDEHRATLAELVRRALIEVAGRRRERLRGSPTGMSFDPLFANRASVQLGAHTSEESITGVWQCCRRVPAAI